jgi:hypothetical protein
MTMSPADRMQVRCWTTVLAPPVLWAANFEARYVLANPAHRWGSNAVLHWVTLVTTLVTLGFAFYAWRWWRELHHGDDSPREAARFMLGSAVLLGLFFAFITLTDAIPALILSPTD